MNWRFLALAWDWIPDWLLWLVLTGIVAGLSVVCACLMAHRDDSIAGRDDG